MTRSSIKGTRALLRCIKKSRDLQPIKDVVSLNGAEMARSAQRNAPIDTGNMKGSIRMELENNGLSVEVSPRTEYDVYVEKGTRFQHARPFIGPAYRKQKVKFIQDLKELCE